MKNFHIIIQKNKNVIVILSIWLIFYLFIILLDSIIKLNLIQTKKKKRSAFGCWEKWKRKYKNSAVTLNKLIEDLNPSKQKILYSIN